LVLATSLIFQGMWASLQFVLRRPLGKSIEPFGTMFSAYGYVAAEQTNFFRSHGTWDHPNTLGVFSTIFLIFLIVQMINPKLSRQRKRIFLVAFILGVLGLFFSGSRASWVVFSLMLFGTFVFFKKGKFKKRIVFIYLSSKWFKSLFLICLILGPLLILPRLGQFYFTLLEKGGVYYRSYLLEKAWYLSQEAPLGIGLATFPAVLIKRFGFFTWPAPVHNLFLEILVEAGVFSLTFFLLFLIFTYKEFFLKLPSLKQSKFFLRVGAFFASLSFLLTAQFYPFFFSSKVFEYFWFFLGMMLC
jgi:O-antigen ligase